MIVRVRFRLLLVLFIIAVCSLTCSEAAEILPVNVSNTFSDSAPKINLMEMVRECPAFASYPGYDGVIWLRQHTYQIDMSGSMSVTSVWVILGNSELESKWLDWIVQIPKGGDAQVFEASLYDPGSLTQIETIEPQRKGNELHINFRPVPEEFILVLSYRESYERNLVIQGMLWLNENLPIWEQSIIVNVETGRDFGYATNSDAEPVITSEGIFDVYKWMIVNQMPAPTHSLRANSRSWLAFGNKQPLPYFVKLLESYAKKPVPAPPSNVEAWLKKGKLSQFFNWLQDKETDVSIIGIRDEISEKAPWSKWEKSIIASSWINRYNDGSCRLFWRLAVDPSVSGFANESIILGPAIEIKRLKDTSFYEIGQLHEPGVTSLSLIGETLYSPIEGNRLEKRMIPPRGASVNRLSVIWNLNVAENNTITGTVSIIIRNAWKDFLMSDSSVNNILREITGRITLEKDIKTINTKDGIEINAPLKPSKIILGTSGTNAIISLYPPQPNWLTDLSRAIIPFSIKFPMSIEAIYKINLPAKVNDVFPPQQMNRDGGKIKYVEKYEFFKRSRRLEATVRLTLQNTKIDKSSEQELAFALGRFGMQRTIPLRIK